MSRYWASWYEPIDKVIKRDDVNGDVVEYHTPRWPVHIEEVAGWSSGWRISDDARTYCAIVDVLDKDKDTSIARTLDEQGFEIRFVEPRADDWVPEASRFPMPSQP